jgi:DnaJ-domain-containing protein 1
MTLDHDTGEMRGHILKGRRAGAELSSLSFADLLTLGDQFHDDAEALRLLESYLDRVQPGWRDDAQGEHGPWKRAAPASGGMDTKEAYQFLGLEPGASDAEVRAAHRRLMKQVHPDRGGSAALAAKINEAKDRILGKHH